MVQHCQLYGNIFYMIVDDPSFILLFFSCTAISLIFFSLTLCHFIYTPDFLAPSLRVHCLLHYMHNMMVGAPGTLACEFTGKQCLLFQWPFRFSHLHPFCPCISLASVFSPPLYPTLENRGSPATPQVMFEG